MSYSKKFFDLTIGPEYVPLWGIWEAVRELIQNGLDGAQDGFAFDIHRGNNGTVVIRNKGAVLLPKHLILGETSKVGGDYRGQYGEGFKLGMLALCRIAKASGREDALIIHTGTDTWIPTIHKSEEYGTDIIRVNTYPRKNDGYLTVEVPGVTLTDWLKIQDRILTLGVQKKIDCEGIGEILLEEKYKSSLFCKGLWVSDLPNPSKYGYNLTSVTLDRDRKMADSYSLKTSLSRLLSKLCLLSKISCGEILNILSEEEDNLIECEALRFYPSGGSDWREFKASVAQHWMYEHGVKTIPVSSNQEAILCATLGQKYVEVSSALKEFLGENVLQLKDVEKNKAHEISRVYNIVDLSKEELDNYTHGVDLAQRALPNSKFSVAIVDFTMPTLGGYCSFQDGSIFIVKQVLDSYAHFMNVLIHELAHLPGYFDQTKEHVDEATHIAGTMIELLQKDNS